MLSPFLCFCCSPLSTPCFHFTCCFFKILLPKSLDFFFLNFRNEKHQGCSHHHIGLEASHSPTPSMQPSVWWNPYPLCCIKSRFTPSLAAFLFTPHFFFPFCKPLPPSLPRSPLGFPFLRSSLAMSLWASLGLVAVGSTRTSHIVT